MPKTLIRAATIDDAETILALVQALAIYEKEPISTVKATAEDYRRDGFGPEKRFETLIAELDGEPVGFALYFHNYSTWEGRIGLFVEDLFVLEKARGHGLGRQLITALAAIADARGCKRLDLSVLDWNPTREFYHRLGILHKEEWLPYRMTQPALARLGDEADPAWFPGRPRKA